MGSAKKPWYAYSKPTKSFKNRKNLVRQQTTTKFEDRLAVILKRNGIAFERQALVKSYTVDFLIPPNTIVEVTGSVHKVRRFQDLSRTRDLEEWGYQVIIIPNHLLLEDDANEAIVYKINSAVKRNDKDVGEESRP